ncbi:hypothetical protein [Acidianus sp. RZ1]|uniref:hypothetical protein n=1 Tax=Acidianus sp. RZ1 TaxID=1540082 RepID=UPI0014912514|nr:hypothetical protein [Acidianus sp. RZ1]NON61612.1 hypothetical protein [Acidianus sp. RZ1]
MRTTVFVTKWQYDKLKKLCLEDKISFQDEIKRAVLTFFEDKVPLTLISDPLTSHKKSGLIKIILLIDDELDQSIKKISEISNTKKSMIIRKAISYYLFRKGKYGDL